MNLTDGIEGLTEDQVAAINANAAKTYEGYESPEQIAGLKAAKDSLLAEKKQAEEAKAAATLATEAAKLEAAKKGGDIESITKSYEEKLSAYEQKLSSINKASEDNAISAVVSKMAAELGGDNAALLEPHLRSHLRYEDGVVKVTDSDGGLTISTLDDLSTKFRTNPAFAPVIVGSKANGGGAKVQNGNSGGAASSNKPYKDMTLAEKADHIRTNPPKRQ